VADDSMRITRPLSSTFVTLEHPGGRCLVDRSASIKPQPAGEVRGGGVRAGTGVGSSRHV
jgi:hypothetical protein